MVWIQAVGRIGGFGVLVTLVLLATSTPSAAAAPKSISGKLNKPGYTVIALGPTGQKAVRARRGKFRLRPSGAGARAQSVTLHLRRPNGTYGGPIVVGRKKRGKRAIVGVKPGAKLGRVKLRRGYAKPSRPLPKKWVDASRVSRARRGVPIGARTFGRVLSPPPRNPIPGDWDFDGVPDPLDIDDDGDLILDDLDRSPAARAAQQVLDNPALHTSLELTLTETVNVNAGSNDQQIEQLPFLGVAGIRLSALFIGPPPAASTELDCGRDDPTTPTQREGLIYCSTGNPPSKGKVVLTPGQTTNFPDCCDSDGDGFGTLVPTVGPIPAFFTLHHGATTTEIKTGQVLIKRINDANGVEIASFSNTLQYVFATVPALVSYEDGAGNTRTVSYPVAPGQPPPGPPGGPGTNRNEFPVAPRPAGDPAAGEVLVTVTLWQPQRRPIVGEPGYANPPSAWTDIGGLTYSATVDSPPQQPSGLFVSKQCPQDAYFVPPGQPFVASTSPADPGLTDTLLDRLATRENKLTYTLNLSRCLGGIAWNPGESVNVTFRAAGRRTRPDAQPGYAVQSNIAFKR